VGRAIELRKNADQDADSLPIGGRQHGCFALIASEQSVLFSTAGLPVIRSESSNASALFQASKRIFAPEAIRYS
jgi:hypothetical protein